VIEIGKADAVVTVTGYSGIYDAAAHGATGTVIGVDADGAALGSMLDLGASFTDAPGGTAHWVFTGGTNYLDQSGDVTIDIAKAEAVVTVLGYSGTYDAAAHGATGSVSGVDADGAAAGGSLDLGASFTDAPGGTAHWVFTGGTNYLDESGDVAIDIAKADAVVTVTGYSGTYDAAAHGATGSVSGVGADGAAAGGSLDLGASFTDAPGGTAHWVFTGGTNYLDESGDVAITIAKADAVVTVTGYSGTYDAAAHGATGSVSGVDAGGAALGGTLDLGASFTNAPGGTAHWVFTGGTNYLDESGDVAIHIASAPLTIAAVDAVKIFGTPNPAFAVTYTGFVGGEDAGSLGGTLTFTTPATISSPVGVYPVTPGGLNSTNYAIDFVPGTLTVAVVNGSAYVLNRTVSGALFLSGNAVLNAAGDVVVDSSSASAVKATGTSQVTAAQVLVVGGVSTSGSASVTKTGTPGDVGDPLAGLVAPTGGGSGVSVKLSGQSSQTIDPGVYREIKVSSDASLTLNPGVYFIDGGGISVTGNGSLQGDGVTIYNAGSGTTFGGIALTGKGSVHLSAPTSGPYAGIAIFQARDNNRAMSISGNGMAGITGTIYAPAALLSMSGNGAVQTQVTYVVDRLQVSGNGSSSLSADGSVIVTEGVAGELLGADLFLYLDNSAAAFGADGLARLDEGIAGLNVLLSPYNVAIMEVDDSSLANLVFRSDTTSAVGGLAEGVLGCFDSLGTITLIQGWDWYAGVDPAAIEAGQYDFQTVVTHELGHALGLGHSTDVASVMNDTLPAGMVRRAMTEADLNVGGDGDGPEGLHAVPFAADAVDRALAEMLFDRGTGNVWTDALRPVLRERRALPEAVGAKSPAVFGPARENVRTGSPEVDWYFAKHDSRASDETTDLTAAEFADDLDWILDL